MRRRTKLNRRGSALVLYAIMLTGLLGCMALAIDVGMGFDARSEAQRVADSSALAGASAYFDGTGALIDIEATNRAEQFATSNYVGDAMVVTSELQITPSSADKSVEVIVTRQAIPVWFARLLGVLDIDVQARAVAKVDDAGTANQCILPFAPPDIWHDADGDTNGNRLPDIGEEWDFDANEGDLYEPWDGSGNTFNGYGYGSNWRDPGNDDVGMRMYLKAGPPGQADGEGGGDAPWGPGNFLPWRMPDPDQGCEGSGSGLTWLQENIANCNSCPIGIGEDYTFETEPGNMTRVLDDMANLIAMDENASWPDGADLPSSPDFPNIYDSPRVRPIAFLDPTIDVRGTSVPISFTNIAWIFVESAGQVGGGGGAPEFTVTARFMGVVPGTDEGPNTGPLLKYLRLVE